MYEENVGCIMHQSRWLVKWDQNFCCHGINLLEVGIAPGQYPQIQGRCAVEGQRQDGIEVCR